MNATVTVTLNGQSQTLELDGDELSRTEQADGSVHAYLTNASKWVISEFAEKALIALTHD